MLLFVLLLVSTLFAAKAKAPEKFKLVHSDKLYMSKLDNEQVLELNGNVNFFYGSTQFRCARALILDEKKIARLYGNVVVANDSLTITADTLAYYRIPELMNMGGRITATHSNRGGDYRWMKSDYASYNKAKDILTCWSKVVSYDKRENSTAHCGYAQWDRKAGYALLLEEPRLQAGTADSLFIAADKMEFFDKESKLIATFNVKVDSRDYHATSDFLIYFMEEEKAVFTGEPAFYSDYATAKAREFHLFFTERKLNRAELIDSCRVVFAEERLGEQKNTVNASLVRIEFSGDQIKEFVAESDVSYFYQQDATDKKDFLQNSATGSYLQAKFDADSKLQTMQMKTDIKGTYIFQAK
jgi:lipopolysaccharide export system protein LptA